MRWPVCAHQRLRVQAVAESFKARGNDALAEGDVQGAIKLYSQVRWELRL